MKKIILLIILISLSYCANNFSSLEVTAGDKKVGQVVYKDTVVIQVSATGPFATPYSRAQMIAYRLNEYLESYSDVKKIKLSYPENIYTASISGRNLFSVYKEDATEENMKVEDVMSQWIQNIMSAISPNNNADETLIKKDNPINSEEGQYVLIAGTVSSMENAKRIQASVSSCGFNPKIEEIHKNNLVFYRVVVARFYLIESVDFAKETLTSAGIDSYLLTENLDDKNELGKRDNDGLIISKNLVQAYKSLSASASSGNLEAYNLLTLLIKDSYFIYETDYYKNNQKIIESKFFNLSLLFAREGNVNAISEVMYAYYYGKGVKSNIDKSFYWASLLLAKDNIDEALVLEIVNLFKYSDELNENSKLKMVDRILELNYTLEDINLAIFYLLDFNISDAEKIKRLEKLYLKGNTKAALALFNYYSDESLKKTFYNKEKARDIAFFLAEKNPLEGCRLLGNSYFYGDFTDMDYSEAVKYYSEYLNQEYSISSTSTEYALTQYSTPFVYYNLGIMYYFGGYGLEKDFYQAKKYFELLLPTKSRQLAYFRLAYMYWQGLGGEIDLEKAKNYFEMDGGYASLYNLGIMYGNGDITPRSESVAIDFFKKAAMRALELSDRTFALTAYDRIKEFDPKHPYIDELNKLLYKKK